MVEVSTQNWEKCKFAARSVPEDEMGGELATYGLYELYGCANAQIVLSPGARKECIGDGKGGGAVIAVFKLSECGLIQKNMLKQFGKKLDVLRLVVKHVRILRLGDKYF